MRPNTAELIRYSVNGAISTAVHYGVLTAALHLLHFQSAGFANFVAAIVGMATSFLGSRYFVFYSVAERLLKQAVQFIGLYSGIAVLHGLFLWMWTDCNGLDYRVGFAIATTIQAAVTYFGNKFLVFKA